MSLAVTALPRESSNFGGPVEENDRFFGPPAAVLERFPAAAAAAAGGSSCRQPPCPSSGEEDVLPIHFYRKNVLSALARNDVICVQGETGCGKSSMVPQFIYNASPETCCCIVTQPRRLPCIALAKRVSEQLGESSVGGLVGYKISGESRLCGRTQLVFATTGFLLQELIHRPGSLSRYTHVILDEVHERTIEADLLSLVLKLQRLSSSPDRGVVKIIVMSATLQGDLFGRYLRTSSSSSVETLHVGAKRFRVVCRYLDELLTGQQLSTVSQRVVRSALGHFSQTEKSAPARTTGGTEPVVFEGFNGVIRDIVTSLAAGGESILVFLAGIADITDLHDVLLPLLSESDGGSQTNHHQANHQTNQTNHPSCSSSASSSSSGGGPLRFRLMVLHSLVSREDQDAVFDDPPADTCHIILASNVAESSLTLPKVRVVIDTCLRRHVVYSSKRHSTALMRTWISKASAKQRLGRTGRVFEGVCIRLVPRSFYEHCMPEFDVPDILSCPLDKLYLQTKMLGYQLRQSFRGQDMARVEAELGQPLLFHAKQLLSLSIQPPPAGMVFRTVSSLMQAGALRGADEDAAVTTLGRLAMSLPLDVQLCRLLLYSIAWGCVADGLILATGLSSVDVFTTPNRLVMRSNRAFCEALARSVRARAGLDGGELSEPLMVRQAVVEWIQQLAELRAAGRRSRGDVSGAMRRFAAERSLVLRKFSHLVLSIAENAALLRSTVSASAAPETVRQIDALIALLDNGEHRGLRGGSRAGVEHPSRLRLCPSVSLLKMLLGFASAPHWMLGAPKLALRSDVPKEQICAGVPGDHFCCTNRKQLKAKRVKAFYELAKAGDPSRSVYVPNVPRQCNGHSLGSVLGQMIPLDARYRVNVVSRQQASITAAVTFEEDDQDHLSHCRRAMGGAASRPTVDFVDLPTESFTLLQFGGGRWKVGLSLGAPPLAPSSSVCALPAVDASSSSDLPLSSEDFEEEEEEGGSSPQEESRPAVAAAGNSLVRASKSAKELSAAAAAAPLANASISLSKPENPCSLRWALLNFDCWTAGEEISAGGASNGPSGGPSGGPVSSKPTKGGQLVVEARPNLRNPIGSSAAFPISWAAVTEAELHAMGGSQRGHEAVLASFASQQGTDSKAVSRVEGSTVFPATLGLLTLLASLKNLGSLQLRSEVHLSHGCSVIGGVIGGGDQLISFGIATGTGPMDAAVAAPPVELTLEDLIRVNRARAALSVYLAEVEGGCNGGLAAAQPRESSAICIHSGESSRLLSTLEDLRRRNFVLCGPPAPAEWKRLLGAPPALFQEALGPLRERMLLLKGSGRRAADKAAKQLTVTASLESPSYVSGQCLESLSLESLMVEVARVKNSFRDSLHHHQQNNNCNNGQQQQQQQQQQQSKRSRQDKLLQNSTVVKCIREQQQQQQLNCPSSQAASAASKRSGQRRGAAKKGGRRGRGKRREEESVASSQLQADASQLQWADPSIVRMHRRTTTDGSAGRHALPETYEPSATATLDRVIQVLVPQEAQLRLTQQQQQLSAFLAGYNHQNNHEQNHHHHLHQPHLHHLHQQHQHHPSPELQFPTWQPPQQQHHQPGLLSTKDSYT